ncbi:sialate O-acetylesterase [Mucilaginibacter roseus]|uniref:Sialate O-acetylesterase n=1 Tax=Mucilaginibacter roseus TaxID=1528868 RepID=A0ABS8U0A6_9SPHI|nr:sialate O-acetylesterase [Mucilaginibacter roseus]MCD8739277.1 sialate O-acetylesterase [Mucilaginibacter roseus]
MIYFKRLLPVLFFCFACNELNAQIRLPHLIGNSMVLQRDKKINIWGWASPTEKVKVTFAKKKYHAIADAYGKWQVQLKAMKAGGPYKMQLDASNHITLDDILIGDVWFCAGQSNMVNPMERVKEKYPDEIASANYPQIRNFFVPTAADINAEHDDLPPGQWQRATPQNVLNFGAVSYFMAKKLHLKYKVPIGIINSSVGGTPIEAWLSADAIRTFPMLNKRLSLSREKLKNNSVTAQVNTKPKVKRLDTDEGLNANPKWYDAAFVPTGWKPFWLPGYWADQGVRNLNGVVWFRKEIEVPAAMAGKPAKLFVGRIIDADETYLNGEKVGAITYQYPPRRYEVRAGLLKAGKNILVVRLSNFTGKGGFVPDKRYELTDGINHVDIRGDWLYKVGQVFNKPVAERQVAANSFSAQNEPTGLYNTLVNPATHYQIKGIAWYQGESNIGTADYGALLKALIADWRRAWNDTGLPFLLAQLPGFGDVEYSPAESAWALIREAQLDALTVKNTGLSVAIDAGEWNDIHPLNKKDIGERLALAAQKVAYHDEHTTGPGPLCSGATVDGDHITLTFTNAGSGLTVKGGGKLQQFAIAGADKKFVWADANIIGEKVIVSNPEVPNPKYVRYAWADNPDGANLYNREGLPASPFRTDK